MIPPINCPYKNLTGPPCWSCRNYIPDTDSCKLNSLAVHGPKTNNPYSAATCYQQPSYQERLKQYEEDRQKLLQLSKESLVDMILHRPEY